MRSKNKRLSFFVLLVTTIMFVLFLLPNMAYATEDTWQVSLGTDDVVRYSGTEGFESTTANIYVGYYNNVQYYYCDGFFRWTNITIPQGYSIQSAYVKMWVETEAGSAEIIIYGLDEDNATTFTTDPSSRSLTTDSVEWSSSWVINAWNTSPDIAFVIQEITDRVGWASGNSLALKLDGQTKGAVTDMITVRTYEGSSSYAAKLEVTYAYSQYGYTLKGPYNEETGNPLGTPVSVTAYFPEGTSQFTFDVDGEKTYRPMVKPLYFRFDFTDDREYWLSSTEYTSTIYIFDASTTEYTVQFMDLSNILDNYPFVSFKWNINGTSHTVEKREADINDRVVVNLIEGKRYYIVIEDGFVWEYGQEYFGVDITVDITLRDINFPQEIILAYKIVRLYAERHNNCTSISLLYQDLENDTDHVDCRIKYRNGTVAYQATKYADAFNETWTNAEYNLTYYVEMDTTHNNYGQINYRAVMFAGGFGISPWGLSWLGTIGDVNMAAIIPLCLIFAGACIFSKVNAYMGAFIATILAILFTWWGWIPIAPAMLILALAFTILMAFGYKKKQAMGI